MAEIHYRISAGVGGTVSPSGDVYVTVGSTKLVTATANAGYRFSKFKLSVPEIGSVSYSTDNPLQLTAVVAPSYTFLVEAMFEALPTVKVTKALYYSGSYVSETYEYWTPGVDYNPADHQPSHTSGYVLDYIRMTNGTIVIDVTNTWITCPTVNFSLLYNYTPPSYTITATVNFNANGGTVSPTSRTVSGTSTSTSGYLTCVFPAPSRANYVFDGWLLYGSLYPAGSNTVSATTAGVTHNAVAQWSATYVTATKKLYYDNVYQSSTTETGLQAGGSYTPSAHQPTHSSSYILDQIIMSYGSTRVIVTTGAITCPSVNFTLDYYYKLQTYTISATVNFDANGGTVSPTSRTVSAESTSTTGYLACVFPTPTRANYRFDGWLIGTVTYPAGSNQVYASSTGQTYNAVAQWTNTYVTATKYLYYDGVQQSATYQDTNLEVGASYTPSAHQPPYSTGYVLEQIVLSYGTTRVIVTTGSIACPSVDFRLDFYYKTDKKVKVWVANQNRQWKEADVWIGYQNTWKKSKACIGDSGGHWKY